MRRTMFVVPTEIGAAMCAANGPLVGTSRRTYLKLLADAGLGGEAWLADVTESVVAALAARGEATAAELSTDEPRLRERVTTGAGTALEGRPTITSWVLSMLASEGRIARGRPVGTWTSSQWRWAPMDGWLPGGLAEVPVDDARAEVVRCWLATAGPATQADLRWWTGWTAAQVTRAVAAIGTVEVDLGGPTGLVLAGDEEPVGPPAPWVALLPALDPTAMGWAGRDWYLDGHDRPLFDRTGNIGPTVWCDGRVVGGWAQRPAGDIAYRLFTDVGDEAAAEVAATADRLAAWLGPARPAVRGRARTPLERELLEL
jgi:hypothetical protein